MRRAAKVDLAQKGLVAELREGGYYVAITSQLGNGFPDLVVSDGFNTVLVEVKNGPKDQLTLKEKAFHANWPESQLLIAWNADQVQEHFRSLF